MYITDEPFVFILDLDGTIIGDCLYQTILYNIEIILKKNKVKTKKDDMLINSYKPDSKLVRPYFKYFYSTMKKMYPNSLFYIYTASEKKWATKEISIIEKTHKIKFNRPLFTRTDCIIDSYGQYRKSVNNILPKIIKANKELEINKNNILVVDNNDVFIDYKSNFLLCPTYDYIFFCDIWEKINKAHITIPELNNILQHLISTNKICKYDETNFICEGMRKEKIKELRYKWLYKKIKKINQNNRKFEKDIFWKVLTNSCQNRLLDVAGNIKNIKNKLGQKIDII